MAPRERKTQRMCSFNGKSYVNFNDGFTPVHRCVEAEVAVRRLMLSVTHTKLLSTASGREFGKREEERGRGQRQKSLNEFCVFQQVSESRGNLLVSLASRPLPGGILRKCPHFLFLECVCMCVCTPGAGGVSRKSLIHEKEQVVAFFLTRVWLSWQNTNNNISEVIRW